MSVFDPKRAFDVVVAGTALIVLAPVIAAVGISVWIALGSPVLFRQMRPGLGAKPFELVKFRTMLPEQSSETRPRSDAERLTRFGKFLRSTSLDELPELWNVLVGDMSLVGPRPLLMEYLDQYTPEQARRHDVRPGLTGWTAVNGRNELTWSEKFALDIWYVDNQSFWLDLKILMLTLGRVITRRGAAGENSGVPPRFSE